MQVISLDNRIALADKMRNHKQNIAEAVTEEFFQRHPDWLVKYGERGRRLGIEDAGYHLEFLASAVESGNTIPFEDYSRWTTSMLGARNIDTHFVVENLQQIEQSLGPHLDPAERDMVALFIAAGCDACTQPAPAPAAGEDDADLALAQSLYLQAILNGQRKAAVTIALEPLKAKKSIIDIYLKVIQESLYAVGQLWETNKITVAQEHMATAISQYVVAQLYAHLEPTGISRGTMVITGVQGELHQIGANMVADVLEADGWDVRFLGTNMPHAGILQAIEETKADVLGISATMLFNVPHVIALIEDVRRKFDSRAPRIILGGSAFRAAPDLYKELGVEGFAPDLKTAIALISG
jgi:methanogenic corrinoid protein MtbC1